MQCLVEQKNAIYAYNPDVKLLLLWAKATDEKNALNNWNYSEKKNGELWRGFNFTGSSIDQSRSS